MSGQIIPRAVCTAAAVFALLLIPAGAATAAVHPQPAASAGGSLQAWGSNRTGDLGNGNTGNTDVPVAVSLPPGTKIAGVAAGVDHSLARTTTGRALAWGNNTNGELGDGSVHNSSVPVVVRLPAGARVTSVKAGCYDSLALTSTGRVFAWGLNVFGELGNGTRRSSDTPVPVRLPRGARVTAISAGCFFDLALTASGEVLAWGRNYGGSLGDGNFNTTSRLPVRVRFRPGTRIISIAAGAYHGLAVALGGRVYGWGNNGLGQVGDGTTHNRDMPALVKLPGRLARKVVALACGGVHSLALLSSGAMLAWGYNGLGQLGTGTGSVSVPTPVSLPAGLKIKAIGGGSDSSIALSVTGSVLTWGWNHYGQLGDGNTDDSPVPVFVSLPAAMIATGIGAGSQAVHNFAIVQVSALASAARSPAWRAARLAWV
jgi:alpha-tubulin suppressor-like RCC1 family protein